MQDSCHSAEGCVANEQLPQQLSKAFEHIHVPFSNIKSTTKSLDLAKVYVFSPASSATTMPFLCAVLMSLQDFMWAAAC
jgi:hypothetical protein